MRWLDTTGDEEAIDATDARFDEGVDIVDAGTFWSEQIKAFRKHPDDRLALALDNLPMPAAFSEAAKALRSMIRAKRKAGEDHKKELGLLYWLASIRSLMIPYAERAKLPGAVVMEMIPGSVVRSLPFKYGELGHEELELLNKTDRKWIEEKWGKAEAHTTLNEMHRAVWDEYESKLIAAQKRKMDEFDEVVMEELRELYREGKL